MRKLIIKSLFDGKPETAFSATHNELPMSDDEITKKVQYHDHKRQFAHIRQYLVDPRSREYKALNKEERHHHNAIFALYTKHGKPRQTPDAFEKYHLSKGSMQKALSGNINRPGKTIDANSGRPRNLKPGEKEVAESPKTPPAALHSAMARQGAMFTGYDQRGNAAYWHPEPKVAANNAKQFLNENYGAHLAHQNKSRLLSGESSSNVEHTLKFQHSKDDPSHGVKITNVGHNRAEKMPSAPGRERSATPDQIMDNTSKGSFGSRNQWKDASKAAYGKMEEHAHNAAFALNNWNAKDFANHAAKYIQGNPHLQDKLEQNVAYNWGRRAVQHVNNIRQQLQPKQKKEFFSLAKSIFEGKTQISLFVKAIPNIKGTYHYRVIASKRKRIGGKRMDDMRPDGEPSWQKVSALHARKIPAGTIFPKSTAIKNAKELFKKLNGTELTVHEGIHLKIDNRLRSHIIDNKRISEAIRRARYSPLIVPTLVNPIEVWEQPDGSRLYLSSYEQEDKSGVLHDVFSAIKLQKESDDNYYIATFVFPTIPGYIEKNVRTGTLKYREK